MEDGSTKKVGPGLLDGRKIQRIVEDTESRPQSAMDAVRKLVNSDNVPIVLGEFSSGITLPTGQFTNKNEVIQFAVGATSPKLRDIGPYFFDSIGTDVLAAEAIAKMAAKDAPNAEDFTSITVNNPFGVGVEVNTCKFLNQDYGRECVTTVRYEREQSDYRAQVNRMFNKDPDAALFTAYGTEARLILRQAYQAGYREQAEWYAPYVTMWTNEVEELPQIAEGIKGTQVGVEGGFYDSEYAQPYKEEYGEAPLTAYGAYGYDAMMIVALAIEKAGTTDPDELKDVMQSVSVDYRGVTGSKDLDGDGMQKNEQYMYRVYKDGKLQDYELN
jgi:branched-chain amino acid transport system substrate-binding protein